MNAFTPYKISNLYTVCLIDSNAVVSNMWPAENIYLINNFENKNKLLLNKKSIGMSSL